MLRNPEYDRSGIHVASIVKPPARMKLHHTFAIALLAWLLLAPPQLGDNGAAVKALPLSKWDQMGSYNSAAECNADRESFIKQDQKEYKLSLGPHPTPSAFDAAAPAPPTTLKSTTALCVSDDDPRLIKK